MKNMVEFDKLPPACQRMAIAEDVLKQVEAKSFLVENMVYIELEKCGNIPSNEDELREAEACRVCALGALATSCILGSDRTFQRDDYGIGVGQRPIHELLKGIFSADQLYMIESAFEKSVFCPSSLSSKELKRKCLKSAEFGKRFVSPQRRLKEIMRNILNNKGEFVP